MAGKAGCSTYSAPDVSDEWQSAMLATSSFCFLTAVVKACDVQEPVPGTGPSPPEFDPPERAKPSPPVPQDDPMRPLPPQQPEIPPNERYPLLSLFQISCHHLYACWQILLASNLFTTMLFLVVLGLMDKYCSVLCKSPALFYS